MDLIFSTDQLFILILSIIFMIAIIAIVIQIRKSNVSKNEIKLLEKQAELKKIELVEKDLDNRRKKDNFAELSEEEQEKLKEIRSNTAHIAARVDLLSSQMNERVEQLEAKSELVKLQKLSMELDKKEAELEKKLKE